MDSLNRQIEVIDRGSWIAGRILDQSGNRTGFRRLPDRLGDCSGCVGVAVLQVSVYGQIGCGGNGATMVDRLLPTDGKLPVPAPEDGGEAEAGRCQRLESETGEEPSRADIPRVGNN